MKPLTKKEIASFASRSLEFNGTIARAEIMQTKNIMESEKSLFRSQINTDIVVSMGYRWALSKQCGRISGFDRHLYLKHGKTGKGFIDDNEAGYEYRIPKKESLLALKNELEGYSRELKAGGTDALEAQKALANMAVILKVHEMLGHLNNYDRRAYAKCVDGLAGSEDAASRWLAGHYQLLTKHIR